MERRHGLLLTILFIGSLTAGPYTFEDLKILHREKNYREFFNHALDLPPRERQGPWKKMVTNLAGDYFNHLHRTQQYDQKTWDYIEKLAAWPVLRDDDFFQSKRDHFTIKAVELCLKTQQTPCLVKSKAIWEQSRKDPETGEKLAGLLKHLMTNNDLSYFLKPGFQMGLGEFYCKKTIFRKNAVHQIIKLKEKYPNPDKLRLKLLKAFHPDCWASLTPFLKQELMRSNGDIGEAFFLALQTKNALSQREEDLWLTYYLLQGPQVGPVFNLAWNRLHLLGDHFARRMEVLAQIKKYPYLPDGLFDQKNMIRTKQILKVLTQNFPEYFEWYGDQCHQYYQGIGHFPQGNPTLHCRKFIFLSKDESWVTQTLRGRFSAIKRKLNLK